MGEKRCYSVGEIQHILGICKTTAYNLIKENQFRAMLIGGKYVISKKSFDEWLDGEIIKADRSRHRVNRSRRKSRNDKKDRRNSPGQTLRRKRRRLSMRLWKSMVTITGKCKSYQFGHQVRQTA